MLVREVASLYRTLTGTQDVSVVSTAGMRSALERAHERYRDIVFRIDPLLLASSVVFNVDGLNQYNFETGAVKIIGATSTLTHVRLIQVLELYQYDSDQNYHTGQAYKQLRPDFPDLDREDHAFVWVGRTQLLLSEKYTDQDFVLYYRGQGPKQTIGVDQDPGGVDWSQDGSSDVEDIDQLHWFHDVIAMLAAKEHDIVRWQSNPVREAHLRERVKELRAHVRRFLMHANENAAAVSNRGIDEQLGITW